jgi:hypothetical protein
MDKSALAVVSKLQKIVAQSEIIQAGRSTSAKLVINQLLVQFWQLCQLLETQFPQSLFSPTKLVIPRGDESG